MKWHYFTMDELIESAPTKKWLCYRQTGWKRDGAGGYRSGNYWVATTEWMKFHGFDHLLPEA
jgi:hypothetical protein